MTTVSIGTGTVVTTLRSNELDCPSCVRRIEGALERLDGVESARVYFGAGRIEVAHDPALVDTNRLVRVIREVGYAAIPSPF